MPDGGDLGRPGPLLSVLDRRGGGGAASDATLTRIRGAEHFVMEERPDEVQTALEELLARPAA